MKTRLSTTKLKNTNIEIIDGDRGVNYPKKNDFSDYGYCLFLDASNVTKNGFVFENPQFITRLKNDQLGNGKLKRHDIVLTTRGTIGNFAYYDTDIPYDNVRINSGMLILRNKSDFDTKYLYQLLKSPFIKQQISNITTGSSQPQITRAIIKELTLLKPELPTQIKISDILHTLDKKIELNNKIKDELESMAKLIYDYWFVQFDFPDQNGKPYKSSGGEMIWDEELKRKIPKNWICSNIFSVADLFAGGTPSKKNPKYWNGTIPFFTPTDSKNEVHCLATDEYITEEGVNNCSTQLFDKNTVFVTARGSVGRLVLNSLPMAMNQSCYALRAKSGISYTYLFFLTKQLIQHLEIRASGSVFNSIVSNDIKFSKLAIPSNLELIKMYAKITEPLFEKIELMSNENQRLLKFRNWLLPMLMNGQVKVVES